MKVELIGIIDRGDPDKERVHLKALVDLDLTNYAILDTLFVSAASIQAGTHQCYWCTPAPVKANSNVVIYTRVGTPTTEPAADGTVSHFFFRNMPGPLYTDPKSCAVLFEIGSWATSKAAPGLFG
jgi:hypothetical protein